MRGSTPSVIELPARSKFMVRSLKRRKGLKPRPILSWLKKTGPGESILMSTAAIARIGKTRIRKNSDRKKSIVRLHTCTLRKILQKWIPPLFMWKESHGRMRSHRWQFHPYHCPFYDVSHSPCHNAQRLLMFRRYKEDKNCNIDRKRLSVTKVKVLAKLFTSFPQGLTRP